MSAPVASPQTPRRPKSPPPASRPHPAFRPALALSSSLALAKTSLTLVDVNAPILCCCVLSAGPQMSPSSVLSPAPFAVTSTARHGTLPATATATGATRASAAVCCVRASEVAFVPPHFDAELRIKQARGTTHIIEVWRLVSVEPHAVQLVCLLPHLQIIRCMNTNTRTRCDMSIHARHDRTQRSAHALALNVRGAAAATKCEGTSRANGC